MLGSVFRFELAYQLRGAAFLAIFVLFFLLVFGAVTVDQLQIGSSEAVNINSPSAAFSTIAVMGVIAIFMPVVFMATTVTRDKALKTAEVFGAMPVPARTMLLGRYLGGLVATALCFLSVPLAFWIGTMMPWLDQEQMGPAIVGPYFYIYLVFGVLNLAVLGTILFTVANLTRSTMATWVALVAIFIGWVTATSLTSELETRTLAALLEPFGFGAAGEITRYWTAQEQNTQVIPLEGLLLQNRLLYGGLAVLLLLVNLAFPKGLGGLSFGGKKKAEKSVAAAALRVVDLPKVTPSRNAALKQFATRVRFESFGIMRSVAFWVVLILSIANTMGSLLNLGNMYGTESYPITRLMIGAVEGAFAFVPIIVAVYYTSELIWRERGFKFNEIVDATPTPSWVFVGAKFAAVAMVLLLMTVFASGTAIAVQLAKGFTFIELGQYAVRGFFYSLVSFTFLAAFALFVQVAANNKWVGIGIFLAYFVGSIVMDQVGFDHWLYNFGSGININYSDMNEYGPYLGISSVMSVYWGLFVIALSMLTFGLWSRGSLDPMLSRIKRLPSRLGGRGQAVFAGSLAAFAAMGGFVYYNTNVLNEYQKAEARRDAAEEFERTYRQYEWDPQPEIVSVDLDADLYPKERRAVLSTEYVLENQTDEAIATMQVDYARLSEVQAHEVEGARVTTEDEGFNHYIFTFDPALQPGERRVMKSTVEISNPGFRSGNNLSPVRENGTFIDSSNLAQIGWGEEKILTDRAERRKRGLEELPRAAKLEDERYWSRGLFSGSDWVDFRAVITTDADQIAVTPGYLVSDTVEGDRRTFVYEQDTPIQNFYSIQSARYEVAEDVWEAPEGQEDVKLQVFYDQKHPYNVERMIEAMRLSFDKFTDVFTPFQYRQMRIQEFPYASFAQSFPNTVPYSENIGFILKVDDSPEAADIDAITYVTAHEVAHQWFGHQLSAAPVQGATMLIESFAQYGAFLVMEDLYGPEQMRRFLRYELDRYLSGRANEPIEEMPLYRVENQQYIHYQKGGHVLYLLRDQIGEETLNRAIRRMLTEWGYKSDPYPRTVDFLAILREEAGEEHEQLITDLFERIVLYDVEVLSANVTEREDGRFDVSMKVDAKKLVSDGQGNETEEPLSITIDIAAFSEHPKDVVSGDEHIIAFERREVVSGEQSFTFTVDERPTHIGADPYNKLIDRRPENNVVRPDEGDDTA
ncbi:ABC transporter permease/M1 family aminopeptidase [Parvularcula maris]|uniref:Peptidase M1 membrane alanine aminopeptidase domain-containing protein n=1 Tax=Parvularcula maris TaxID=2965077 RepID=A0A9X2L8X6_9PROT|nr:M1 family aminopeptidase [Parvularcula maris]MCQ8185285.1 hypothetical protein [Parvularcula maris]